jgi:UDP-2,3-diacylglucosamine hydrolase
MTVLFIADIHLSADRPDLISAFVNFIDKKASKCHSLYLLGDIFEAWIGDDYIEPAMETIVRSLQQLSHQGTHVFLLQGNRDFLMGTLFAKTIGATLLEENCLVDLPSEKALIMHGDQLCTDDIDYQQFRVMVRSKQWQQQFLDKPIAERLLIAQQLRAASKEQGSTKSMQITDVNQDAVIEAMNTANIKLLIHGHTHRPNTHSVSLAKGSGMRMVLGDWGDKLWYIECTDAGCQLVDMPIGAI